MPARPQFPSLLQVICFHPSVVSTPQSSFWKPDVGWPDVRAYWMANCRVPSLLNAHFLHLALGEVPGQRCPSQTTQAVCKACLLSLLPAVAHPPTPQLVTKASQLGSGASVWCGAEVNTLWTPRLPETDMQHWEGWMVNVVGVRPDDPVFHTEKTTGKVLAPSAQAPWPSFPIPGQPWPPGWYWMWGWGGIGEKRGATCAGYCVLSWCHCRLWLTCSYWKQDSPMVPGGTIPAPRGHPNQPLGVSIPSCSP